MQTTLNKIKNHSPCKYGWEKLLNHLGKTQSDDESLELRTILESNGLNDTIWAFRALEGKDKQIRLFAADCADMALPFYEKQYPDDNRPRLAIQAARDLAAASASDAKAARDARAASAGSAARAAASAGSAARAAALAARAASSAASNASAAALAASAAAWAAASDASSAASSAASNASDAAWAASAGSAASIAVSIAARDEIKQILLKYI